jgi:peptidoglycan/xylan/chitin deacetylase (PgdA/CDA1 family)
MILMYHRVAEVAVDPWGQCVSPANFASHLEILRRYATPLALRQRLRAHPPGVAGTPGFVVTLDDGYADALHGAKPLLEAHDVPATVFVVTGNLGRVREFWWDELDGLLLRPGVLPPTLELRAGNGVHRWTLGPAASYGEEEYRRNRRLRAFEAPVGTRHALYHAVWKLLFPLPEESRRRALDAIAEWAGGPAPVREAYRSLRPEEVRSLGDSGLVEIAAHTVTHPVLPAQSAATQRREIVRSRDTLQEIVGRPVTSFSYPHGECSRVTTAIVREAGFTAACTVAHRRAAADGDPLRLPRFGVLDWSPEEFEERVASWIR